MFSPSRGSYPQNPHKTQGGWIQFAIAAAAALLGNKSKNKADKQASAAQSEESRLRERELALAEEQDARSGKLFKHYETEFMPREKKFVADAFGNELSPARAEARATTDVRDALDTARDIGDRNLRRRGVDPSSGNVVALDRNVDLDAARIEAGARTGAREGVRDRNFARQYDALALGRNLPSMATSMTGQAQQGIGNASAVASRTARLREGAAYDAGSDFSQALVEAGSELYDLYKGRRSSGAAPAPAGRGGSWG